jgi:hypothetical protein
MTAAGRNKEQMHNGGYMPRSIAYSDPGGKIEDVLKLISTVD